MQKFMKPDTEFEYGLSKIKCLELESMIEYNTEDATRYLLPVNAVWNHLVNPQTTMLDHKGIVFDIETTGFEQEDEILSFGYVKFTFDDDMTKVIPYESDEFYNRKVSKEIPQRITDLTGIDRKYLDEFGYVDFMDKANAAFEDMALVVAHFAKFDISFFSKFSQQIYQFDALQACTIEDIDWEAKFAKSASLGNLLAYKFGLYLQHHNAMHDAIGAFILMHEHFEELIENASAKAEVIDVYARNSPYQVKDKLKEAGFKWNPEANCWIYYSAKPDQVDELKQIVTKCEGDPVIKVGVRKRFE